MEDEEWVDATEDLPQLRAKGEERSVVVRIRLSDGEICIGYYNDRASAWFGKRAKQFRRLSAKNPVVEWQSMEGSA